MKDQGFFPKKEKTLCNIPYKCTCPSETSVAVDGYLPLLQCEGHDLHHVQDSGKVGHSVVTPTKIVKVN